MKQYDRKTDFTKDGRFAPGNKGGGAKPRVERTLYQRSAQSQYRAWISQLSDGGGIGCLPPTVRSLLKCARTAYEKALYLGDKKEPSDNEMRSLNTTISLVSRLLAQADNMMKEYEIEDVAKKRVY